MRKTGYQVPKNDEKKYQKNDLREQKNAPVVENWVLIYKKNLQKQWIRSVLCHVFPTLDEASDPPGYRSI
jgi:hypothetical protein